MNIKHLVISGGGPNLFTGYGLLKKLNIEKFWNLKDIETIHATSAGAIIGLFIALNIEWDALDDYFIKRPWEEVFNITPQMIFDAYSKKGIYNKKIFEDIFEPFFRLNELPLSINFEEFYEKTKIDINMYCTDINEFKLICLNYKKFPKMSILEGVHASSSIAPIFSPVIFDKNCFLDGGILSNYPLVECLESNKNIKKDEVLGIIGTHKNNSCFIEKETTITDYILKIIYNLIDKSDASKSCSNAIDYEICYPTKERSGSTWKDSILLSDCREKMIKNGENFAEKYLSNLKPTEETAQEPT